MAIKYIEPLSEAGERAAEWLTSTEAFGGAVAYSAQPCLVIYGCPVWIMPNGMCRVGEPDAPMVDAEHAARTIREVIRERREGGRRDPWTACRVDGHRQMQRGGELDGPEGDTSRQADDHADA